ncbi:MAG TPA: PCMD domain-containing protein [Bacteroidales bacterium]|nr:PCMD domain-containing protein [Bacteroidales bacterium]
MIPNAGFENWIDHGNYADPQYWDTPNAETATLPIIGRAVVVKSTDAEAGNYSAKLVTQNILGVGNIPGFITLGTLTVTLFPPDYTLHGGIPINDHPTHLMGWFKFVPVGGDSCTIGILLTKLNAGVIDTVGYGYFSSLDTVTQWTHFSAWIDYVIAGEQPDTMNVMAISSAEETTLHEGTTLWVDDLSLDYTVGIDRQDPDAGIYVYNDRERKQLVFNFDLAKPEEVSAVLYGMTGRPAAELPGSVMTKGSDALGYGSLPPGMYVLEILHNGKKYTQKFLLNL